MSDRSYDEHFDADQRRIAHSAKAAATLHRWTHDAGECGALCPEHGDLRDTSVKRPDLFGAVHDTYQTEAELNGWKPEQGPLL